MELGYVCLEFNNTVIVLLISICTLLQNDSNTISYTENNFDSRTIFNLMIILEH